MAGKGRVRMEREGVNDGSWRGRIRRENVTGRGMLLTGDERLRELLMHRRWL